MRSENKTVGPLAGDILQVHVHCCHKTGTRLSCIYLLSHIEHKTSRGRKHTCTLVKEQDGMQHSRQYNRWTRIKDCHEQMCMRKFEPWEHCSRPVDLQQGRNFDWQRPMGKWGQLSARPIYGITKKSRHTDKQRRENVWTRICNMLTSSLTSWSWQHFCPMCFCARGPQRKLCSPAKDDWTFSHLTSVTMIEEVQAAGHHLCYYM